MRDLVDDRRQTTPLHSFDHRPSSISPLGYRRHVYLKQDRGPGLVCRGNLILHAPSASPRGRQRWTVTHIRCHEPQIVWTNTIVQASNWKSRYPHYIVGLLPLSNGISPLCERRTSPSTPCLAKPKTSCPVIHRCSPFPLPKAHQHFLHPQSPCCTKTQILSMSPNQTSGNLPTCNRDPPLLLHSVLQTTYIKYIRSKDAPRGPSFSYARRSREVDRFDTKGPRL